MATISTPANEQLPSFVAAPRAHPATVRAAHWIVTLCFIALLWSGIEILISHPRFYWGETGNILMTPLFTLPIPSSRALVQTGYGYVLPDQNGWSRSLHFQTAWILVLTGLAYVTFGVFTRYFRKHLIPARSDLTWRELSRSVTQHLRFEKTAFANASSYNQLQRLAYLTVIFFLFPLVIWTGLAMSPAVVSVVPFVVTALGGQQSARTIHFFASLGLSTFVLVHILMVIRGGFKSRVMAMITGNIAVSKERP